MKNIKITVYIMLMFNLLPAAAFVGAESTGVDQDSLSRPAVTTSFIYHGASFESNDRPTAEIQLTMPNGGKAPNFTSTHQSGWETLLLVLWLMLGVILFAIALFIPIKAMLVKDEEPIAKT